MTERMRLLALIHVAAFKYGANDIPRQGEYLLEHLTEEEFKIGGNQLMLDPDAALELQQALEKIHPKNYRELRDSGMLDATIARHINNARSAAEHGGLGYYED